MYATVRVYRDNEGLADALAARQSEVKEIISGIAGFNGYYLLKTADGAASISVYETMEGAEESSRVAGAWVKENLPEHVKTPPEVAIGEVVVDSSGW
jgi:heme-degrading monooxygenase HmoA